MTALEPAAATIGSLSTSSLSLRQTLDRLPLGCCLQPRGRTLMAGQEACPLQVEVEPDLAGASFMDLCRIFIDGDGGVGQFGCQPITNGLPQEAVGFNTSLERYPAAGLGERRSRQGNPLGSNHEQRFGAPVGHSL